MSWHRSDWSLVAALILAAALLYWGWQIPDQLAADAEFARGWNACVATVQEQNPQYVLPSVFRNLTLNASAADADTADTVGDPADGSPS